MRVVGLGGDESPEGAPDVVVAIDGPAGSGKSTVARRVAELAGLRYLDTGATYRALTLALLRRGVPPEDPGAVADAAKAVDLTLELGPGGAGTARVLLDGVPVGPELRSPQVNAAVSAVAAGLRTGLSLLQAISLSADEVGAPLGATLRGLADRVSLGVPFPRSLDGWVAEVGLPEARLVAGVLSLQRRTGGDLPVVLDRLARTLRDRQAAAREVRRLLGR